MPPMPVAIRLISMASRKPGCMLCRSRSAARCILTKGKWKKTAIANVARTGFAASPARSSNGAGKLRAGPPPNKKWPPRRAAKVWEETPRDGAAAYSRRNDNAALQQYHLLQLRSQGSICGELGQIAASRPPLRCSDNGGDPVKILVVTDAWKPQVNGV